MMNVLTPTSVASAIRTLDDDDRRTVAECIHRLENWDTDSQLRASSRRSRVPDILELNASGDVRLFFRLDLQKKEIIVLDVAKPSRFETAQATME